MALINPVLFGGSAPTTGDYLVRFIDFDGTILKEQWVNAGQAATAPTPPTHQYLTFDEWNNTFTNVQHDLDVGATYYTTDGKTYLFCRFTANTGLQPTLYLNKATTAQMDIDWGDGSGASLSGSGNISVQKAAAYSTQGSYSITISCADNYSFTNSYIFGNTNYSSSLLKLYTAIKCITFGTYAFRFAYSLEYVAIHKNLVFNGNYIFNLAKSLRCLIIPKVNNSLPQWLVWQCQSLAECIIAETITTISASVFQDTFSLNQLILSNNITTLGWSAFNGSGIKKLRLGSSITAVSADTIFSDMRELIELLLPDSVIGACGATYGFTTRNYALRKVYLPAGITSISANAFYAASSLLNLIICAATPPTLANINAFTGLNIACKIYVPDASVSAYQAATNWVTYASYIYPISELAEYAGTIFFQSNGGNAIKQIKGTVGAVATEPTAPTKTGFTFAGWYKEAALTNAWNWASDVYPATNITLYAKWV